MYQKKLNFTLQRLLFYFFDRKSLLKPIIKQKLKICFDKQKRCKKPGPACQNARI